jgi:hypothetical protein
LRPFLVKSGGTGIMPALFFEQAGKEIRKKTGKLPPGKRAATAERPGRNLTGRSGGSAGAGRIFTP